MNKVKFYPSGKHEIKIDHETQSRFWVATSAHMMFTYFEVPPQKKFASHSHESEQITYVIEGKLFFEIDKIIYPVGAGDLISIPSFIEHSVWTEGEGAKAVDSWSPGNDKYL